MTARSKRRKTLLRRAEYLKYVIWRAGDFADSHDKAEFAALLWAIAIIDELKERGLLEDVGRAAEDRFVPLRKLEVASEASGHEASGGSARAS